MNALKSIFSWLGRFLEKARTIMLNLGTAFVLIFFAFIIIGALTSMPEVKDPSGRVLLIDPEGTVVDQAVFNSDFLSNIGTDASTDQIQTRDLIQIIRAAAEDRDIDDTFEALVQLQPKKISNVVKPSSICLLVKNQLDNFLVAHLGYFVGYFFLFAC